MHIKNNLITKITAILLVIFLTFGNVAQVSAVFTGTVAEREIQIIQAQEAGINAVTWNGTYPTTRPAGMDDGAGDYIIDINTAEEFAWIMSQPNMFLDGISGVNTVRLNTDINLANHPWTPSLAAGPSKSNTFDGGDHTISNLYVPSGEKIGLFGRVPSAAHAKIQNLTVNRAELHGSLTTRSYVGVISGSDDWMGDYENVHVMNATIYASKYAGAIAAYGTSNMTNVSATNITFHITEIGDDKPHVGGLIGLNNEGVLDNADVSNVAINIVSDDGVIDTERVGALIGTAQAPVVINPNSTATDVTYNGEPLTALVGLDNRVDTRWYDPAGDNYVITTIPELKGLDDLLNGGTNFLGKTVLLGADIDLAGQGFLPLGSSSNSFKGTFDGQNHTLSNLNLTHTSNYAGFFAKIEEGGVKNLNVDNFDIKAPEYAGAVAGQMFRASIENVHISNSTILSDHFGGGVTGHLYGNAKNSSVTDVEVSAHNEIPGELGNKLGGLAGYVGEGAYVLEYNTGTRVTVTGIRDVGGLFGTTNANNKVYNNTITDSTVTASNAHGSETNAWAGGIVGRLGGKYTTFGANENINTTVTSYREGQAGPIYGGPEANALFLRVYNETQDVWYASIKEAVNATVDGDVLRVEPGTYDEEDILINKGISLYGAPNHTSIIAPSGATNNSTIKVVNPSANVLIDGFKFDNPPRPSYGATVLISGTTIPIDSATVTVSNNIVIGEGNHPDGSKKDYGLYGQGNNAKVVWENNVIHHTGGNALIFEQQFGSTLVRNNTVYTKTVAGGSLYYSMVYGDRTVNRPQIVENNTFSLVRDGVEGWAEAITFNTSPTYQWGGGDTYGHYINIQIRNNTILIDGTKDRGIGIADRSAGDGQGTITDAVVTGNTIIGQEPVAAETVGVMIRGDVQDTIVRNNTFTNLATGVRLIEQNFDAPAPGAIPSGTIIENNKINTSVAVGVNNDSTDPVDASPNWWGVADGPTADRLVGPVLYNPYWIDEEMTTLNAAMVTNVNTGTPYWDLQTAINAASAGDRLVVSTDTFEVTGSILVDKAVIIEGSAGSKLEVSGPGPIFDMAAGATLKNLEIEKTDKVGTIVNLRSSGVQILDNVMHGRYTMGDPEVSRAIIVTAGTFSDVAITGNTFHHLRQPAYISGFHTGLISENYVYHTRGWVVENGNFTFEDNTWGTGADANAVDIAILTTVNPEYYADIPALSAANNDAIVEDQRGGTKLLSHVYVDDDAAAGGDGTPAKPYQTIAEAIDRVVPGGTVHIANGTYAEKVTIRKAVKIIGESRDGVIIDTSASTVYGVHAYGDIETSFANLTIIGPASTPGSYGLKIAGENAETTITNVLVKNSARTGIDLNGLNGAVITDVVLQNNAGNGLSLTNSSNVTVTNITTSGNTWGGIAVYTDSTTYSQGADNISITGTNSSNEPVGFYTEIDPDYPPTNLNVPEFHFTVVNNTDRENFTFYAKDQAYAVLIATNMPHPEDSYIRDIATSNLLVFPGMTIQAAIDAANPGDTVLVAAGTYEENVYTGDARIIKGLTVRGIADANGDFPLVKGSMKFGRDRSLGGDYVHKNLILENFRIEANLTDTALFGTTRHALWVENFENAQLRNLDLVGTEPNSMFAIQYGLSVGGRAKDYTIDNVTMENFLIGVYGRALNMTIQNSDISYVEAGANIMGGGNLTITDSSIVTEVTRNDKQLYAVRFGEGNTTGTPSVLNFHVTNSTLALNNPGGLVPTPGNYMRSVVLRGNAGGDLVVVNSNIPQGINNIASVPITADGNWWGSADKPVVDEDYVGLVNFCSWLDAPTPDGELLGDGMVTNQRTGHYYCSIQAAIDDAEAGDVLVASAGTFVEQIVIDKAITLQGPNFEKAGYAEDRLPEAIVTFPEGITEQAQRLVNVTASDVSIVGLKFEYGEHMLNLLPYMIRTNGVDNLTVKNNIIYGGEAGIHAAPVGTVNNTGLLVEGNLIDGGPFVNSRYNRGMYIYRMGGLIQNNVIDHVSIGIQFLPHREPTGLTAQYNDIKAYSIGLYNNNQYAGSGPHKWIANTVGVAENPRGTAEMGVYLPYTTDVTFRGIHVINHGLYGGTGEPPLAEFYNNILDGTYDPATTVGMASTTAVRISSANPDSNEGPSVPGTKTIVHNNAFDNFDTYINNTTTVNIDPNLLDASGNWWGTTDAAALFAGVTAGSDYTPWLASGTDNDADVAGFQGDFSTLYVDDDSFQVGAVGRIQEAIDLVSGSTIYVLPGTYQEAVVVDKAVNLYGPNMDVNPNGTVNRGPEAIILGSTTAPAMSTLFELDAENVVVKGFTFDNVRINNYIDGGATGTLTNQFGGVDISNNIFTNVSGTALYLRDGRNAPGEYSADVTVQNNLFNAITSAGGVDYNAGSAVVVMGGENLLVDGNVIEDAAYNGIQLARNNNVTVSNNTAVADQPAIQIAQWNEGTQTISGNDLQTSHASKAAMRFYAFTADRTPSFVIENNVIHDSVNGIQIGHGDAGKGDDISTADYSFAGNTFTDITGHELVVYLPAEATADQLTEMVEDFRQVYDAGAYVKVINGVDPYTYVVNYAPVAVDDAYTVEEDHELVVSAAEGVLANDTDAEGDPLTAVLVTGPTHAAVNGFTLNPDGSFSYKPGQDYFGEDTFTYKIVSGETTSNIATVTITVTPEKDQVIAEPDFYAVDEDSVLTVSVEDGVLANDEDVDLNHRQATLVESVKNGTLTLNADGSFVYTPKANFHGEDTFTYRLVTYPRINAENPWIDEALVTITVNPILDPPALSTDMPDSVMTGVEYQYGVTLDNPNYGDTFAGVRVLFTLSDTDLADIASLKYYEVQDGTWKDLPLTQDGANVTGWFGPAAGFPMTAPYNATSQFKLTMAVGSAGTYAYEMGLYDVVADPDALLTSLAGSLEVIESPVVTVQDFYYASSSTMKGVSADIRLDHGTTDDATSIVVELFAGEPGAYQLLQTNTANLEKFNAFTVFTSPFDIFGTRNYVGSSWSNVREAEYGQTLTPTRVLATITLLNGDVISDEEIILTGDSSMIQPSVVAEDFGYGRWSGILGVNAGFHTVNFNLGQAVDVKVELFTGEAGAYELLQTNTWIAENPAWDGMSVYSAPFDIFGNFDYAVDGYWTNVREAEYGQTAIPTRVLTTITLPGGVVVTAENTNLTGDRAIILSSLDEEITEAANYVYDPVYEYTGDLVFDDASNTYAMTYWPAEYLDGAPMRDLARYLGALHYQDISTVESLTYKGVVYTWDAEGTLVGSNWKNGNDTLVSVIVADLLGVIPGTVTVTLSDGYYTEEVSFVVDVYNTLDAEIASAPDYEYDPVYNYVGTFTFEDESNTYTATYTDDNYAPGALYDLARYLGALHRQAGATVIKVTYKGVDYTWNPAEPLKGSNWEDADGTTLVSVVSADFQAGLIDPDVTFTVADGIHTETVTFIIVIEDTTAPEIVSITAIGGEDFDDVLAVGGVITVDQGYTVEKTEIELNEEVTVVAGTVVSIDGRAYGTITAEGTKLIVVPYVGNEIASQPGTFAFSVPAGSIKDLAGNALVQLGATLVVNNVAPVAAADAYTTEEDIELVVATPGVLANDVDWTPLTVELVGDVSNGTLTLNEDGSFSYLPDENWHGTDSFTYKVSDGELTSNTATVTITVTDVKDQVNAVDDEYETDEDTVLTIAAPGVLANDKDVDGNERRAVLVTDVAHGTLKLNADGSFTYTPAADWYGEDSFVYELVTYPKTQDLWTDTATVTLTVNPVNDAPVLDEIPDMTIPEKVLHMFTVTATDVDSTNLTFSLVNAPAGASINATTGVFKWTPTEAQGPAEYTFTVKVCDDGEPVLCDEQIVKITVEEVNLAPRLYPIMDSEYTIDEETELTMTFPAEDDDLPAQTLTFSLVDAPEGAVIDPVAGSFTWTPTEVQGPGTYEFTVKVCDDGEPVLCAEQVITVTVEEVNLPPVLAEIGDKEVEAGVELSFTATATDPDIPVQTLTFSLVGAPEGASIDPTTGVFTWTPTAEQVGEHTVTVCVSDGELEDCEEITITVTEPVIINLPPVAVADSYTTDEDLVLTVATPGVLGNDSDPNGDSITAILVDGVDHGVLTLNADGSFVYTPEQDYNGTDSFTYKAIDGELESEVVTVTITINPVNDAPVAEDIEVTTPEDTAKDITLLGSDVDGDTLAYAIVVEPANGTVTLVGNVVTYTPNANFNGTDSFTYKANDGELDSNVATVTITITPVNDVPVAEDIEVTTPEDTAKDITLLGSDVDGDTLTYSIVTEPSHGTFTLVGDVVTYTPNENWHGTDSFTYKVNDGELDSNVATVTITVTSVNDAPVAVDDAYTTTEDVILVVAAPGVLENDYDVDGDTLSTTLRTDVSHGSLTLMSDGSFTYLPDPNFFGTDSFTYTLVTYPGTTNEWTDWATVTITVTPVNDAPVLDEISDATIPEMVLYTFTATATDVDSTNLTFSLINAPAGAAINATTGVFSWTPTEAQGPAEYTFTVKVCDDGTPALCDQQLVNLMVEEVNIAPDLAPIENKEVEVGAELRFTATATDPDLPVQTLIFYLEGAPAGASINASTGVFTWIPVESQVGVHVFEICVTDGALEDCQQIKVTVLQGDVNTAPVAVADAYEVDYEGVLSIAAPGVLANDTDADGDVLTAILVSTTANGTLTFNEDGSFLYIPRAGFSGTDTFKYKANDGDLDSNIVTVTITVKAAPPQPVYPLFFPIIKK